MVLLGNYAALELAELLCKKKSDRLIMSDTKNTYPIPDAGYPQKVPPVVAPPQYSQATTMASESHCLDGFLEGCISCMCFLCLLDGCCDPSSLCNC